jgi:hypothetical protein
MAILHIEHPITDLDTWLTAFSRFAEARRQAGVTATHVFQPHNDPKYVVVKLEFQTAEAATQFLSFLREVVWASPAASPALAGEPKAVVLDEVPVGSTYARADGR